jgi:cell division protein FtsB
MTRRRRRDGERDDQGPGAGGPSQPRVQGAWDTPAVVVRAPDGSIVPPGTKPTPRPATVRAPGPPRPGEPAARRPAVPRDGQDRQARGEPPGGQRPGGAERAGGAERPGGQRAGGAEGPGRQRAGGAERADGEGPEGPREEGQRQEGREQDGREGSPGRRPRVRVRPRRIPGAPGAVLVTPTLRPQAADGRVERRQKRLEAPSASVTPLPPRPERADGQGEDRHEASPAALRSVGSARGHVSGRGARRPTPARPGEPRTQRVLQAVAALNLNLDRLLPADEEARQRRLARLRRVGMRVASVTLAGMLVYAVFPVRTYLNQRAATERAREQIEVLSRENDRLEERAEDLREPETIEEIARRELGLVMPGEESYGILPAPQEAPPTTTTVPAD